MVKTPNDGRIDAQPVGRMTQSVTADDKHSQEMRGCANDCPNRYRSMVVIILVSGPQKLVCNRNQYRFIDLAYVFALLWQHNITYNNI